MWNFVKSYDVFGKVVEETIRVDFHEFCDARASQASYDALPSICQKTIFINIGGNQKWLKLIKNFKTNNNKKCRRRKTRKNAIFRLFLFRCSSILKRRASKLAHNHALSKCFDIATKCLCVTRASISETQDSNRQ